ncbi:hypothetical protein EXIGLDRAFT_310385 [Exidia glandulosa HHB12029]|uniref:Uncharacterized protein n=1 Tax=Exidia glandulosa HHB12029 TaxID=1314781 RepID=A0A165ZKG4_EXIGL|nr:hypothetical protein EXIGLDRAFT_310385 [Exidia glandulosa HHB12029]
MRLRTVPLTPQRAYNPGMAVPNLYVTRPHEFESPAAAYPASADTTAPCASSPHLRQPIFPQRDLSFLSDALGTLSQSAYYDDCSDTRGFHSLPPEPVDDTTNFESCALPPSVDTTFTPTTPLLRDSRNEPFLRSPATWPDSVCLYCNVPNCGLTYEAHIRMLREVLQELARPLPSSQSTCCLACLDHSDSQWFHTCARKEHIASQRTMNLQDLPEPNFLNPFGVNLG